jgi:C_GCAxxG_C_C family probable redox protein
MSRAERAKEYFMKGYACSQAVALAFADKMAISEADIVKLSLPFGGGLGRLRLTCGAVSGMAMVIGAVFSSAEQSAENKKEVYALVQEVCARFQNELGSLICADLLSDANVATTVGGEAEARTEKYYQKRPCGDIVYVAAEILENFLKEKGEL